MTKLLRPQIWERIYRERLTEPALLNLAGLAVWAFGSFRQKVAFDLVVRQQHAFALLNAADKAKAYGYSAVTAVEFGVANGAGLVNICRIADRVTEATGIRFNIVGFDTGGGMPPPRDYRDHPEYYRAGDFPMHDYDGLRALLPSNARLILGDLADTLDQLTEAELTEAPLGFVSLDVDYYWSTVEALGLMAKEPFCYLPTVDIYIDDIGFEGHCEVAGELLAVREFNEAHKNRHIAPHRMIIEKRIFKRPKWLHHMYTLHVLDHPIRQPEHKPMIGLQVLHNPYLRRRA